MTAALTPALTLGPTKGVVAAPSLASAIMAPAAVPKVRVQPEAMKAIPAMVWPFSQKEPAKVEADPGRTLFDSGIKKISREGSVYSVNGTPSESLGFGSFKETLVHPADPAHVVKVFYASTANNPSIQEKRLEAANIKLLEKIGGAPKMIEAGAVSINGKPTGYIVQERVRGTDLRTVDAAKLREVRKLFDNLASEGLEIADTTLPQKLRSNIMVGTTESGGFKAYLVDADLVRSKMNKKDLKAFYDRVYAFLQR